MLHQRNQLEEIAVKTPAPDEFSQVRAAMERMRTCAETEA